MKKVIIILMGILLLVPLVTAHAIEKGPISKSTDTYNIQFSTAPKFPVTGKATHLDFTIKDKASDLLSNLNAKLELHKQEKTITLDLIEEQKGHYGVEYNFNESRNYEIHIVIDNKELETEFDLEIGTFGLSGLLRSGIIVILLLLFIGLMIKDCWRGKNG